MLRSERRPPTPDELSPGLAGAPEDDLRMTCRQAGCWRFGAPQLATETRCRACGSPTVEWPLSDSPSS